MDESLLYDTGPYEQNYSGVNEVGTKSELLPRQHSLTVGGGGRFAGGCRG